MALKTKARAIMTKHSPVSRKFLLRTVTMAYNGTMEKNDALRLLDRWKDEGRISTKVYKALYKLVKNGELVKTLPQEEHTNGTTPEQAAPTKSRFWCQMDNAAQKEFCHVMNDAMFKDADLPFTVDSASSAEWYDPTAPNYFFVLTIPDETERQYTHWLCAVPMFRNIRLPKDLREHVRIPFERDLVPFCFPQDVTIIKVG